MLICQQGEKKLQMTSSTVQRCGSPLYWIYTGVSQSNLIQNGFVIKQHSFLPNKRAWGQKNPFPLVLKLEAGCCIMLGGARSQILFVMNGTVCTAAARTSLVEEGWRGSLQNGSGGDAAKHLLRLGSHSLTLFKTRKKLLIVKS